MVIVILPSIIILSVAFHYCYAECHYAEYCISLIVKLNVIILNVVILIVVMLSVMAPLSSHSVKMKIPSFIAFKKKKFWTNSNEI
jgi:hypothetical protein